MCRERNVTADTADNHPKRLARWAANLLCLWLAAAATAGAADDPAEGAAVGLAGGSEVGLAAGSDAAGPEYLREQAVRILRDGNEVDLAGPRGEAQLGARESLARSLHTAGLDSLAAAILTGVGWDAYRLAQPERALEAWRFGLRCARATGDAALEAMLLNDVAIGHALTGEYERSVALFRDLIPLRRILGDAMGEGKTWSNLANAYVFLGRLPEAESATRQALSLDRQTGNTRGRLANYNRLAGILLSQKRPHRALGWCDSAEAVGRGAPVPARDLGTVLRRKAAILFELNRPHQADEANREALRLAEEAGDRHHELQSRVRTAELALKSGRNQEALDRLIPLRAAYEAQGREAIALQLASLEGLALVRLERYQEAERLLRESLAQFEAHRDAHTEALSRAGLFTKAGGGLYSGLAQTLAATGRAEEAYAVIERGRAVVLRDRLAASTPSAPVGLGDLRAQLRQSGSALLQYDEAVYSPQLGFLVTPGRLRVFSLGDPVEIRDRARLAQDLLAAGEDAACAPILRRLAELVMPDPVRAALDGFEHLTIVPPAELAAFPFEVLPRAPQSPAPEVGPGAGAGSELGDQLAIAYAPSASVWVQLARRVASREGFVGLADPDFRMRRCEAELPVSLYRRLAGVALPEARAEARAVTPPAGLLWEGGDAQASRLRSAAAREAGVLHLATHAVVQPLRPQASCLLLAGDDPFLSARDVEALDLRADWVALSGCHTQGGYTLTGEGTIGLARSFHVAGARSVLAARWDVSDAAARAFMEHVYAGLARGLDRGRAVQAARVALRAEGRPHRDRSAFALSGVGHQPVPALAAAGRQGEAGWLPRGVPGLAAGASLLLVASLGWVHLRRARRGGHHRGTGGGRTG